MHSGATSTYELFVK